MKREKLMTEEYFDEDIKFVESAIRKRLSNLKHDPNQYVNVQAVYYNVFKYNYQLLISKYSRGYNIADLRNNYIQIILVWEQYFNQPNHEAFLFDESREDYELALWLFSIGVLLKIDRSNMENLLKCIDNQGKDALFEKVVAKFNHLEFLPDHDKLVYPKIYRSLYAACNSDPRAAQKYVEGFLGSWYRKMEGCYWHDNHKGKDGGGFFGYWCWEAALIVYLWNLDDSSFREMPYYPKDMVDFAKNQ